MKKFINILFLLCALPLAITACATKEKAFEKSPYGKALESMMKTCMDAQKSGALPGVGAGEDTSLEFISDQIEFDNRNEFEYPLTLGCTLVKDDQKQTFRFTREAATSVWTLVE